VKQHQFQSRHDAEWTRIASWLSVRGKRSTTDQVLLDDIDFAAAYRRLCQHYAVAQRRGYSASLLMRLRDLVHRGHVVLYRPPAPRWRRCIEFLSSEYPRLVRRYRHYFAVSATLLFLPMIGCIVLLQWRPELVHTLFDAEQLVKFEAMYDPQSAQQRLGRDSGSDMQMFGHYVMNNVSIGFRTFASGLLGAVGPVFTLMFNGVVIGAIAGHLTAIGYGEPFWRFVVGHSAPELLAIVISGAAGLLLGMALLAPGQRSRARALIEDGAVGAKLVLGVFAMLLFAAFVEAFWSSIGWMPDVVKYGSGGALWLLIGVWLWRGGRNAGPDPRRPHDPHDPDRHAG
jgi:uncharacterized membrane protein SpoIIM required for sporulation